MIQFGGYLCTDKALILKGVLLEGNVPFSVNNTIQQCEETKTKFEGSPKRNDYLFHYVLKKSGEVY